MTSSATSDPIKLFDDLDHTYPLEKFLADISVRVTFQLGPQPLDVQSHSTWHSSRQYSFTFHLTGTVSNWYDRFSQVFKKDWSLFIQIFQKTATLENVPTMFNLKHAAFQSNRRVEHISSSSLESSVFFHSLVQMVE